MLTDRNAAGMPGFPHTYAALDTAFLLDVYARGPDRIRLAMADLPENALRTRPIPDKWSIREIALHVADSELVGAVRMRMVLGADQPPLPGYDQDRWSRDLRYQRADATHLARALDLFESLRAATLPLLEDAAPADWSRTGAHPEHGLLTLRHLLELYADHAERHIAQIVERRELLDTPLDLPLLLSERLY